MNGDPPVHTPLRAPEPAEISVNPGWGGSWRGIWLLTWKAQASWRRIALRALSLLVLPALVWTSVVFSHESRGRGSALGQPEELATAFIQSLGRSGSTLSPEAEAQFRQIVNEEFARAREDGAREDAVPNAANTDQEALRAILQRIGTRTRDLLNARQMTRYENFCERRLQRIGPSEPRWGRSTAFYHWVFSVYFLIVLPLSCVRSGGALIRDELQGGTLGFLITRPVTRAQLLAMKFLSQTAMLQLLLLLQSLLLFIAGAFCGVPGLLHLAPLLLGVQVLAVFTWSGLGILFGQITKRYLALAVLYGVVVELGIGRIPTNINNLSLMRHLKSLLAHNPAVQRVFEWPIENVALSITALSGGAILFVTASALLFTFIEYHRNTEMQK